MIILYLNNSKMIRLKNNYTYNNHNPSQNISHNWSNNQLRREQTGQADSLRDQGPPRPLPEKDRFQIPEYLRWFAFG